MAWTSSCPAYYKVFGLEKNPTQTINAFCALQHQTSYITPKTTNATRSYQVWCSAINFVTLGSLKHLCLISATSKKQILVYRSEDDFFFSITPGLPWDFEYHFPSSKLQNTRQCHVYFHPEKNAIPPTCLIAKQQEPTIVVAILAEKPAHKRLMINRWP